MTFYGYLLSILDAIHVIAEICFAIGVITLLVRWIWDGVLDNAYAQRKSDKLHKYALALTIVSALIVLLVPTMEEMFY
jgi:hypothetical protein